MSGDGAGTSGKELEYQALNFLYRYHFKNESYTNVNSSWGFGYREFEDTRTLVNPGLTDILDYELKQIFFEFALWHNALSINQDNLSKLGFGIRLIRGDARYKYSSSLFYAQSKDLYFSWFTSFEFAFAKRWSWGITIETMSDELEDTGNQVLLSGWHLSYYF